MHVRMWNRQLYSADNRAHIHRKYDHGIKWTEYGISGEAVQWHDIQIIHRNRDSCTLFGTIFRKPLASIGFVDFSQSPSCARHSKNKHRKWNTTTAIRGTRNGADDWTEFKTTEIRVKNTHWNIVCVQISRTTISSILLDYCLGSHWCGKRRSAFPTFFHQYFTKRRQDIFRIL